MATKKTSERAMTLLDELKSIFTGTPKTAGRKAKARSATPKAKTTPAAKTKKKSKAKRKTSTR